MNLQRRTQILLFLLLVALVLGGCGPTAANEKVVEPAGDTPVELTEEPAALTPEEVTEAFYGWYVGLLSDRTSETFVNPLVEGLYRDSEYLSADFIGRIDAELAARDGPGGGDPILLAQDVPVQIEVQEASINGAEATVVLLRYWGGNPEPSPLVVHLRQENGRWLIDNVTPFEVPETSSVVPQALAPTADMDPVAVTQAFYDWYLAYIGDRGSGELRNPLVDRAYQGNPLLTPEFTGRVDEILASFEQGGYDPFLLAQDVPSDMFGTVAVISGNVARVTVLRVWGPPQMDAIFAHLRRDGDVWLIDDVTTVELYEPTTETPEGTVQMFYAWYTDALRRRFEDDSVVVDYHDSELLTEGFKQHLDEIRAAAEAEFPELGLGYDPLLCAQDVPYHVTPDQALFDGETAALTARTSFVNHIITVDLEQTAEGWRINGVTCSGMPEASAKAFYTWYLGYIGDRGTGEFRNPLADRAYRGHLLLSEAFVREVDAMFDPETGIGYDPFLVAQEVPRNFSVEPGTMAGTVVVHFQFGPELVTHVLVSMAQEGGRWVITGVRSADTASTGETADNWRPMTSEEYDFTFAYPSDWEVHTMKLHGAGEPEDWPMMAGWRLMPAEVAEVLANQGPPDPTAPVIVAPFSIEVVVGDEDAVARVYRPLAEGEAAVINGSDVTIFRNEPGYTQVVFRHPARPDVWVVFTDWVTEFPGREAQGEVAAPVWEPLLNSLQFHE